MTLPKKRFKRGDRVLCPIAGKGTVNHDSHYAMSGGTWTCVVYDDWLGQKESLCGDDSELILLEEE